MHSTLLRLGEPISAELKALVDQCEVPKFLEEFSAKSGLLAAQQVAFVAANEAEWLSDVVTPAGLDSVPVDERRRNLAMPLLPPYIFVSLSYVLG